MLLGVPFNCKVIKSREALARVSGATKIFIVFLSSEGVSDGIKTYFGFIVWTLTDTSGKEREEKIEQLRDMDSTLSEPPVPCLGKVDSSEAESILRECVCVFLFPLMTWSIFQFKLSLFSNPRFALKETLW